MLSLKRNKKEREYLQFNQDILELLNKKEEEYTQRIESLK